MAVNLKFKKTSHDVAPFSIETLHDRLIKDKAIDMRNNYYIEELNNDYVKILPKDKSKLYK
jgi:hypothetical protein